MIGLNYQTGNVSKNPGAELNKFYNIIRYVTLSSDQMITDIFYIILESYQCYNESISE